ncbi:MAG: glycosyltransferase [Sphingobacteriaceae bacterium]|nr:glycosyltransferase [Sphingobacteriaceae bacterium]
MNIPQHILMIGTVWPEPNSSAAGSRTMQLIEQFQKLNWKITFACAAADSNFSIDFHKYGIEKITIELNNSSFDDFIKKLQPNIVLFDRFMIEEQFGWRVAENCPNALRVLDTIDLHCLRLARQQAFKEKRTFVNDDLLQTDVAKREIASIYRCDMTLMISTYEMDLLQSFFKIDADILHYTPFLLNPIQEKEILSWPLFEDRKHFVTIGNFLHEPNWNAVLFLKEEIWPLIRKELPDIELHVYGAYPSPKVTQLHQPKEGFLIKGRADSAQEVMLNAKVCLAPLRFGAGLKGKLIDAMECGTPSVTTSIGAEAMHGNLDWAGAVSDDVKEFVKTAIQLYSDKSIWLKAQKQGAKIINQVFEKDIQAKLLMQKIDYIQNNLTLHRQQNFIGSMLMHHTISGTKYMSRWIEEKNKKPL